MLYQDFPCADGPGDAALAPRVRGDEPVLGNPRFPFRCGSPQTRDEPLAPVGAELQSSVLVCAPKAADKN